MQICQSLEEHEVDEMKIQRCWEYDRKNDVVMEPSSYFQVVMASGIFGNWKQPIFYGYDCKFTTTILHQIIVELEKIDYHVVGIVSDLGGTNRGLWKDLNIPT